MLHISAIMVLAMAAGSAAGVPESTCSTASSSPITASVVPFESKQEGQVVVPLYFDGTGPWRFLVDTGSSHSAISEALATKIGMPPVAQIELADGGTTRMRPVVRMTNLTVGCARAQALLAPTLSNADLRRLGSGVVGVLGQDFLSRFSFTLDYRASLLVWELGEPREEVSGSATAAREGRRVRLPMREADGRFLIDLAAASFVPASAVDGMVLFGGAATNQLLAHSAAQPAGLMPVDNRRAARLVTLKRLQIGATALWDVPAVILFGAEDDADAPEGDGLLPLSLFARVTFNTRLGYLEVEPR